MLPRAKHLRQMSLRQWVVVGTAVVIVASIGLVVTAYVGWTLGLGTHDRGVTVVAALTADALFAGLVAVVLALAAYWLASGTPDLGVEMTFNLCESNKPAFKMENPRPGSNWREISRSKNSRARIVVRNLSKYSARNPGVRIKLFGFMNVQPMPGWTTVSAANMVGITEFGWDGGTDQMIHGTMPRTLPDFMLTGAQVNPKSAVRMIVVTLVADGIPPKSVTMPVRVVTDQEWSEYMKEIGSRTFSV